MNGTRIIPKKSVDDDVDFDDDDDEDSSDSEEDDCIQSGDDEEGEEMNKNVKPKKKNDDLNSEMSVKKPNEDSDEDDDDDEDQPRKKRYPKMSDDELKSEETYKKVMHYLALRLLVSDIDLIFARGFHTDSSDFTRLKGNEIATVKDDANSFFYNLEKRMETYNYASTRKNDLFGRMVKFCMISKMKVLQIDSQFLQTCAAPEAVSTCAITGKKLSVDGFLLTTNSSSMVVSAKVAKFMIALNNIQFHMEHLSGYVAGIFAENRYGDIKKSNPVALYETYMKFKNDPHDWHSGFHSMFIRSLKIIYDTAAKFGISFDI